MEHVEAKLLKGERFETDFKFGKNRYDCSYYEQQ